MFDLVESPPLIAFYIQSYKQCNISTH